MTKPNHLYIKAQPVAGGRGTICKKGDGLAIVLCGLPETDDNKTGQRMLEIVARDISRSELSERFAYWAQEKNAEIGNMTVEVIPNVRVDRDRYGSVFSIVALPDRDGERPRFLQTVPCKAGHGALEAARLEQSLNLYHA